MSELEVVLLRLEALADQGYDLTRFYGDKCETCHTQHQASWINLRAALAGTDEATKVPRRPVGALERNSASYVTLSATDDAQGPQIGAEPVVHACPNEAVTSCCGRTLFELPPTDRVTGDSGTVTCDGDTP